MTTPPYASGSCANSLYACRVTGGYVQCMPTGYGRTVHPPGNNFDYLSFPLSAPKAAGTTPLAPMSFSGGDNPVIRNMKAAAVQAEQYQAVLSAGGDKLRFIAEAKAKDLTSARVAGLAAEAKIQGEAAAKSGAALTVEQKARADAEARAASASASASTLRYLIAAAALAGAWYWYASKGKRKRA